LLPWAAGARLVEGDVDHAVDVPPLVDDGQVVGPTNLRRGNASSPSICGCGAAGGMPWQEAQLRSASLVHTGDASQNGLGGVTPALHVTFAIQPAA